MRSGTRSECKRRWTPSGHRPACKLKLGYEYVYLYVALNPYQGSLFSLLLPDMSADSFTLFNQHFCLWLNERYGVDRSGKRNKSVALIADGAGAHQSRICEGCDIALVKLPPASPELNPVERFFQELRKELANHIFDTIQGVEEFLITTLKKYYDKPQTITSLTKYPYTIIPNLN